MITLTIVEEVKKDGIVSRKRSLKLFTSTDKARKEIVPIVKEMKLAKRQKRVPKKEIIGVSYDTKSEKSLLLELDAITSIENERSENIGARRLQTIMETLLEDISFNASDDNPVIKVTIDKPFVLNAMKEIIHTHDFKKYVL